MEIRSWSELARMVLRWSEILDVLISDGVDASFSASGSSMTIVGILVLI